MERLLADLQRSALQDLLSPPDNGNSTDRMVRQIRDAEDRWKRSLKAKPVPYLPRPRAFHVPQVLHRNVHDLPRSDSEGVLTKTTFIGQDKYYSAKALKDLQPITLRRMQCNRRHECHYLLCRTFLSAVRSVAIELFVEDTSGDTIMIMVYYMPGTFQASRRQLEAHFPVGTILVVREPWMKTSGSDGAFQAIRVDAPSDIIALTPHPQSSPQIVSGIQWNSPAPDNSVLSRRSAGDWKATGDGYFREGFYIGAAMAWTHAFNINPSLSSSVLLNRAQAYIKLEWYGAALADALHVMHDAPADALVAKAKYRAARAEYGLGLYAEAIDHLETLGDVYDKERQDMIERCRERLKEQEGQFDFLKLYRSAKGKGVVALDTADYVSPAIHVAEISSRGGGRGIKATQKIAAGELLMVHKPFAAATPETVSPREVITVLNCATRMTKDAPQFAAIERAVSRVLACPVDMPRIMDLHAGPGHTPPPSNYALSSKPGHSHVDPLAWDLGIDVSRVEGIVAFNAFQPCPVAAFRHNAPDESSAPARRACALYTSPSLFNHACHSNASWVCFGTTMVIRALADISAGEEITISYTQGDTLSGRVERLKSFIVTCDCAMCAVEKRDTPSAHASRQGALDEMQSVLLKMPESAIMQREREARRILRNVQRSYAGRDSSKPTGAAIPRPVLFRAYTNVMHTTKTVAQHTGDESKLKESITNGIESLKAIGFEDVDEKLGSAALSTRFTLPVSKRRLGYVSCLDLAIHNIIHFAAAFMGLGEIIRAERWFRTAWWVHDTYYGGGLGLFNERFGHVMDSAPRPPGMSYRWD